MAHTVNRTFANATRATIRRCQPNGRNAIEACATFVPRGRPPASALLILALLAIGATTTHARSFQPAISAEAAADQDWLRWDTNRDGIIDRRELVAALKDPRTMGADAGLGAILYQTQFPTSSATTQRALSQSDFQRVIGDQKFQAKVRTAISRLALTSRTLFAEGDASPDGFHQGRDEDCYLLANLALLARNRPDRLRSMLTMSGNGVIQLTLSTGQIAHVAPLTDAEILVGSDPGPNRGFWLQAFEKAFGEIRRRPHSPLAKADAPPRAEAMFPDDTASGLSVPTMEALTGHKVIADAVLFGKAPGERARQYEKVHGLLVRLMQDKALVLLHTRRDKDKGSAFVAPPGWPDAHTFALFGYDASRRIFHCFNPWWNSVHPNGVPGLQNGYVTVKGQFDMPLSEFMALFKSLSYETPEPLTTR